MAVESRLAAEQVQRQGQPTVSAPSTATSTPAPRNPGDADRGVVVRMQRIGEPLEARC